MAVSAERASQLLRDLARADDDRLLALAKYGRRKTDAPVFSSRSLEPDYLEAVATGQWTSDDAVLLAWVTERAEAEALPRVPWRHRRALRKALREAAVAVLTEQVASPRWQRRRGDLAQGWVQSMGTTRGAEDSPDSG